MGTFWPTGMSHRVAQQPTVYLELHLHVRKCRVHPWTCISLCTSVSLQYVDVYVLRVRKRVSE